MLLHCYYTISTLYIYLYCQNTLCVTKLDFFDSNFITLGIEKLCLLCVRTLKYAYWIDCVQLNVEVSSARTSRVKPIVKPVCFLFDRVSSDGVRQDQSTTSVHAIRTVLQTASTGTDVSTVDYRNASHQACPGTVCIDIDIDTDTAII